MINNFKISWNNIVLEKKSNQDLIGLQSNELLISLVTGDLLFSYNENTFTLSEEELAFVFYNLKNAFFIIDLYGYEVTLPLSDFDTELVLIKDGNKIKVCYQSSTTKHVINEIEVPFAMFKNAIAVSYKKLILDILGYYPSLKVHPAFISYFPITLYL